MFKRLKRMAGRVMRSGMVHAFFRWMEASEASGEAKQKMRRALSRLINGQLSRVRSRRTDLTSRSACPVRAACAARIAGAAPSHVLHAHLPAGVGTGPR